MAFNQQEQDIIKFGLQNGKSKEDVITAITNFRSGVVPKPAVPKEPSYTEQLKSDLNTRVDRTGEILKRQDTPIVEKGIQLLGQGTGLAANLIEKSFEQIPGVKPLLEKVGSGINWLATSDYSPVKKLGESIGNSIGNTKVVGDIVGLYDTDPNFRDTVDAIANIARLGMDISPIAESPAFIRNVTNKILNVAKTTASGSVDTAPSLIKTIDEAFNSAKALKDDIQLTVAKKNVNPQLESSANRLFLDGTKGLESPVETYDKYLVQSKKALGDIKADPAISEVGSKMGDAFDTVVKQRQSVGKVLGKELKANGKIKIDISDTRSNLLNELDNSGLSYSPKTNELTSFQGSRFAPEEVSMLNDFVKSLNTLGDNPTVSQIDNFIARTRTTLDFTKGKSGVMGTTNAERIINGGVAKLKETLNPSVNGNTALSKYWRANNAYSKLSDFIDEGSTFLGKKTLSGDYAKDASVAKSSVQSILNQGKKDFMIKLEALTGYPAIDDAVLALQAMKDAGDFRGLSLLQAMSDSGGIPTSKAGFTQQILDYTVKKGGEFVAGTPEQQTRALLQDLSNKAQSPKPINTKAKPTASAGDKTNSTNQINNPMSDTIPQKKGIIQSAVDKYKSIPNKQGGFVRIGGKTFKEIPEATKKEMIQVIDYLNLKQPYNKAIEYNISKLLPKYSISKNWSNAKIADTLEKLVERTKTK